MTYERICAAVDAHYAAGDRGDALFASVRALAMYRLGDEDAAQDLLLAVLTRIGTYRGAGRFNAFVNRIVSDHRTELIRQAAENRKAGDPGIEVPASSRHFSPDFGAIVDPFVRQVAVLLAQGYTQQEIAIELNVRPETLRWRLHRHRRRLGRSKC